MVIKDGKLVALDLGGDIARIIAMTQGNNNDSLDAFEQLAIGSNITNGNAKLDANLKAENYSAKGQGNIDLVQQTIDLSLKAYYTQSKQTRDIAIPVDISGTLANPAVKVDTNSVINQALQAKGSESLNELVSSSLSKFFS